MHILTICYDHVLHLYALFFHIDCQHSTVADGWTSSNNCTIPAGHTGLFVPLHEMIDQKNLTPHKHSTGAADIHNFYNRNLDISLPWRRKTCISRKQYAKQRWKLSSLEGTKFRQTLTYPNLSLGKSKRLTLRLSTIFHCSMKWPQALSIATGWDHKGHIIWRNRKKPLVITL